MFLLHIFITVIFCLLPNKKIFIDAVNSILTTSLASAAVLIVFLPRVGCKLISLLSLLLLLYLCGYSNSDLPLRSIPFRVCANSTSCDLSQGEYVPEAGKWYLQDQIGFEDKSTADFVGVDKGAGGDIANEWFLTKTDSVTKPTQATLIVSFTAKLKCLFKKKTSPCRVFTYSAFLPCGIA